MHEEERKKLEMIMSIEVFVDVMLEKVAPEKLARNGAGFDNKTIQLMFEGYLEGVKKSPARVLGQQLYAEIKADSKYAYQIGWMQLRNGYPFPVRFDYDSSGYVVKGGLGGCYRLEDIDLLFKRNEEFHRIR